MRCFSLHQVKIYLKGSDEFCSFATNGKLALIGMVIIPPNAARSVTVPVLPKRTGEVEVEVSAIFQVKFLTNTYANNAGDSVRRKLLVEVGVYVQGHFLKQNFSGLEISVILASRHYI